MEQLPLHLLQKVSQLLHRVVGVVEDTDFMHSAALTSQHLQVIWSPYNGPTQRVGSHVWTETNSFYDGGFTSAGVFPYMVVSCICTDNMADATVWTWTFQSCAFADHG